MKAIEIQSVGGPEQLVLAERPDPLAGAGEVLIRVTASGVNRPDVLQRKGNYPVPPGASDIPGLEVAGEIVAGDEVAMREAGLKLGERVCALVAGGGYAELCVAPVGQCLPVPKGMSDLDAATLPETFFTVWSNVFDRGHLQAGETLLIQGGTSGIGVTAIQLGKAAGATVIVTCGSDDKCKACLELGADFAINYKTEDFTARALEITGGKGVDVILDMVAGDYVAREVKCMAEDGRLVIIAVQGGSRSEVNSGLILRKRLTVTGSTLRPRPVAFKAAIAKSLQTKVWPWLESGQVKPVVDTVYGSLASEGELTTGAAQAHALMESGQHTGKIVLNWSKSA